MTIEEIEEAVSQLPPDELARFRAWFEEFEAARFDRKIEQDAASGRLDRWRNRHSPTTGKRVYEKFLGG
jgi:hypothetical protein